MHVSLSALPREKVLLSVGDLHKCQAMEEGNLWTSFEKHSCLQYLYDTFLSIL